MLDPFYPVVPDVSWVKRLVPIGTRLIQLRIKDQPSEEIARQVREARDICVLHGAQLIVNDYWQTAIDEGCAWVHLGQEDLLDADIKALRRAGIKIGVSRTTMPSWKRGWRPIPIMSLWVRSGRRSSSRCRGRRRERSDWPNGSA